MWRSLHYTLLKLSDIKKPFIKAWKIKFSNGALLEMDPNQPRVLEVHRHDFGCGSLCDFRLTFTAKIGSVRLQYDDLTSPEGLYVCRIRISSDVRMS
jgi:hypothetical protein